MRHFVTIRARDDKRLRDLQDVYEIDVFIKTAKQVAPTLYEVQALLSDEGIGSLRAAGYQVEVAADAEEIGKAKRREAGERPPSD